MRCCSDLVKAGLQMTVVEELTYCYSPEYTCLLLAGPKKRSY